MEDENIFEYGPYKLYKDAFKENLAKNIDKYIKDHNLTDPEIEQDFRAAVDFIRDGIGGYITHMNGSGLFRDNKGYLTSTKQGHKYAANYINFIANKQGALGNATPKEKPLAEEHSKEFFDPNKHFIGAKFETEYNPTGLDNDYSYWKGTANGTTLHEHLRNYIKTNYLDKGFDQYDFSKTNVTSDYYKGMLNSLYTSLADGVGDDDIKKMQILGFKNPLAFKPVVDDPKLNGNGQENDPTAGKTVLTDDDIADIKAQGFQFGKNNWLNTEGKDTGIPLDQDPRNTQQEQISEEDIAKEIDAVESDIRGQLAPLFLTAYSIASPEPYTATVAGVASDFINYSNTEGNWKEGLGDLVYNLFGTATGVIPWVGDMVGNVPKFVKAIRGMAPVVTRAVDVASLAIGGYYLPEEWEFLKESFNKIVGTDDDNWSTQDIVNVSKLLLSTAQIIKGVKDAKTYRNAKEQARLDPETHVRVKGEKDGKKDIFVVSGDKAKAIKEAKTADEVNNHLSDLGIKTKDLPLKDEEIYNPELVRQLTGDRLLGNKPRGHFGNKAKGQMANRPAETPDAPSAPRTTGKPKLDDLRAKVEAKLKGERGLTDDEVKEIDQLLRKLSENAPKKSYLERLKDLGKPPKPRKEYTDAKDALINKGKYTADEADELLKGFFKQGGILKAQAGNTAPITGTPKNTNPWYSSIGTHFMTDLIKSISDGKFTYMDVNWMQDRHSDLESRLGKTVDNPIFDSATEQYYKDINQFNFVNNKGIKAGEDNQRYKVNPNAYTKDTFSKGWNPDGYYSGRGQDRTLLGRKGDYSDEELATVTQAWKDAGYEMYLNDKNNYYYLKEIAVAPEDQKNDPKGDGSGNNGVKPGEVDGSGLTGDNNSKEITPTGDPMTKKPNRSWEPAFSAFNYFNALRTNKRILDKTNELTPLLYDPVEHPRVIHGDLQAIAEGQKQAAELERQAATPMTSDGSLQQAMQMEAKLKGQESIRAGLKADNDEVKRTTDLAIAQEKEDKNVRHQVAMKNRENMHQVDLTKLQAETTKIRSDYESTKNFVDEVKRYYITEHAKKQKIDDTIYARALQQDIYKNPQNYMPGWNTYHDDIWKRGIAGKQLTSEEQTVFAQLKQQFTNAYYSNLYYNTTPIDTSVKDITGTASDWAIVRSLAEQKTVKEKKGGKLNKDDAKIVLEFLKESNKNYNKAVDRSARGMYNHIKLQRKK